MSGAEDDTRPAGDNRLYEYVQLASADQSVVICGILSQAEVHVPRLLGRDHFARRIPDFRFDAAAADRADHRSVFPNEQLCALEARDRTAHLHDRGECALLPEPAEVERFLRRYP